MGINIFQPHQTFLGFPWAAHNETHYNIFTVLSFSLSVAPYIFTKINRPLVAWWRASNIFAAVFLDDGWAIADNYDSAKAMTNRVHSDIGRLGFIRNQEKSAWEPIQFLPWIGLVWDSFRDTISITLARVQSTVCHISRIDSMNFSVGQAARVSSWKNFVYGACYQKQLGTVK